MGNYNTFYNLLEIKMLDEILLKIEKKLSQEDPDCIEVSRIYEAINLDIIYTGERNKEIILFEIFFGSFIRKEQYDIYEKICNEISNKSNYNIYQLLMGRGKTSVILPLITFKYIFENNNYKNIIISLPSHLVSQSFEEMNNKFSYVLSKYPIFKISKINRNDFRNFNVFDDIENFRIKKIIISECDSLKVLKLNYVEEDIFNNNILNSIRDNSLIVFDEFDSLYNPLNSDLNFPIKDDKKIYKIIDEKIILFYVELIEFLFNNYNIIPELNENILNKFESKNAKYKPNIDLLKNYLKDKDLVNLKYDNNNILDNDLDEQQIKFELIFLKLFDIFESCIKLMYNKDYGFPNEKSHKDKKFAVPYSYVNDPIENSKFSNVDINFFMTILTYFYTDIRIYDIKNIIKIIKDKLSITKHLTNENSVLLNFIKPYYEMIGENDVKKIIKINYNVDDNNHYLEEYKNYFNNLDIKKKNEFKKYYILENVISELKV